MAFRRSKLQIVLEEGNKIFHPTVQDCEEWFRYFNRLIFKGKCEKFDLITIGHLEDSWGECEGNWDDDTLNPLWVRLHITDRFPTKALFVTVLAHEMIHNYQWKNDGVMDHGKGFYVWRDRLADFGLILKRNM